MRVEVVVITFQRPDRLRRAIASLAVAARSAPPALKIGVTVVDDDPERSAGRVLGDFGSSFSAGTTYVVSGSQNISVARNTALDSAMGRSEWVASIDDDVVVPPDWFAVCAEAVRDGRFNAVTGSLVKDFSAGPRWLSEQPFGHLGLMDGEDGATAPVCATGNNWLSCAFLQQRPDLRFDPALGRTGGEDMDFFHRAVGAGLHAVFKTGAAVTEPEPPERCTMRYQVRRAFWLGISEAQVSTHRRLAGRGRLFARAARRAANRGARQLPPDRVGDRGWRYTTAVWSNCAGLGLGSLGVRLRHR